MDVCECDENGADIVVKHEPAAAAAGTHTAAAAAVPIGIGLSASDSSRVDARIASTAFATHIPHRAAHRMRHTAGDDDDAAASVKKRAKRQCPVCLQSVFDLGRHRRGADAGACRPGFNPVTAAAAVAALPHRWNNRRVRPSIAVYQPVDLMKAVDPPTAEQMNE